MIKIEQFSDDACREVIDFIKSKMCAEDMPLIPSAPFILKVWSNENPIFGLAFASKRNESGDMIGLHGVLVSPNPFYKPKDKAEADGLKKAVEMNPSLKRVQEYVTLCDDADEPLLKSVVDNFLSGLNVSRETKGEIK